MQDLSALARHVQAMKDPVALANPSTPREDYTHVLLYVCMQRGRDIPLELSGYVADGVLYFLDRAALRTYNFVDIPFNFGPA